MRASVPVLSMALLAWATVLVTDADEVVGAPEFPAAAVVACSAGDLALTFDDGPRVPHTAAVLDVLRARGVSATFFMTGPAASRYPATVWRVADEGHVAANHTWSHASLTGLSDDAIRRELTATSDAIQRGGAPRPTLMRPPYGATNDRVRAVVAGMGMGHVKWTVDPQDWRTGRSAATIAQLTLSALHRSAIVLLHDGTANAGSTVAALPSIIDGARSRGYCFGSLDRTGQVVPAVPALRIDDARVTEGSNGLSPMTFVLSLSVPTSGQVAVNWATEDGSARAGLDYVAASGTVRFPPGSTTATVQVQVVGDRLDEHDERLRVRLSAPVGARPSRALARGTIVDDDPLVGVLVGDGTAVESVSPAVARVRIERPSGKRVVVEVATRDGTGRAGTDYVPKRKTIAFRPGVTERFVAIALIDRPGINGARDFQLAITGLRHAEVRRAAGTVTIRDDPRPRVSTADVTVKENGRRGYAAVKVRLSSTTKRTVEVPFATASGRAVAGVHFIPVEGTLVFGPGTVVRTVRVPIIDDDVHTGDLTFRVVLDQPVNAERARPGAARVTILDDDHPAGGPDP
jgi:peptidoglycan-N-acetylglucosamine deacetylase